MMFIAALACAPAEAQASVNIPVNSRIYDDLERLEVKGLINSGLLATRPFGRSEAKRLVDEARGKLRDLKEAEKPAGAQELTARLGYELRDAKDTSFIKPVQEAYSKFLYADSTPFFPNLNNNGDESAQGFNARVGVVSIAEAGIASFHLNPEFRADGDSYRARLLRGFAQLNLFGLEAELGRDSMWWGSGFHGNLIMTNNAKPFDMLKLSTEHPFTLPWIFDFLGLFRPTVFLTHLEEERDFSNANLLGIRLDFKPTKRFQLGLNRIFMFGGEGRKSLGLSDWIEVFFASDSSEHSDSPINGNQIVSIDASYVFVNRSAKLPFSGVKLYTEWGAEDSSGDTLSPTGRANIYGFLLDEPFWIENADFRLEWANTARNARYGPAWYTHGVYTTGYKYYGDFIGHHMGTDARDLYLRLRYHLENGAVAGLEFDWERAGIHSTEEARKKWIGLDFSYPFSNDIDITAGLGYDDVDGSPGLEGGAVFSFNASWTL